MTVKQLSNELGLTILVDTPAIENEVEGCYIGDLLSWVMSRAEENNIWLTVMGNVNALAVAKLAELSCVVLCENAQLDALAKEQALQNSIVVLSCQDSAYKLALKVAKAIGDID